MEQTAAIEKAFKMLGAKTMVTQQDIKRLQVVIPKMITAAKLGML